MVNYSPRAAKALGFLKQAYNDIEIFVEDTANQNLWLKVLKNSLPAHVKISSVNMLGGRESVVAACKLDQQSDRRKRLYIIDGDLDFIAGKSKPRLKYLYRLRAYCLENLLLNEPALVEVARDSAGNVTTAQAANLLSYQDVIKAHEHALKGLFAVYAVAMSFNSGIKTVGCSVRPLMDSGPTAITLSTEKIVRRAREVLRQLCRVYGTATVSARRVAYQRRANSLPLTMSVSGKDYLLPPLHLHLRRACNYLGTPEQLKVQLAKEFSTANEPFFARALRQAAA